MQNKLFVRNLSFRTTDDELNSLFSEFGSVVSARIATDRETGRARGFGFVEMSSQQDAESAINALDNQEYAGRTIYVAYSQAKERRSNTAYNERN